MILYEILLLLSAAYLGCYARFNMKAGRSGAAWGAILLAAVPLFLLVTLVCISFGVFRA